MDINVEHIINSTISRINPQLQALPPAVQRKKELQAILNNARLDELLGSSERIERIEKTETGYLIYTDHYTIQVIVIYIASEGGFCGPVHFEIEFCDPVPR